MNDSVTFIGLVVVVALPAFGLLWWWLAYRESMFHPFALLCVSLVLSVAVGLAVNAMAVL